MAVAITAHIQYRWRESDPTWETRERRLAALCIDRTGQVRHLDLGPVDRVEKLVARLRTAVGAGRDRGRPVAAPPDLARLGKALRQQVLDPILADGDGVERVFLSLDESLQLVPLDAGHGNGCFGQLPSQLLQRRLAALVLPHLRLFA